MKTDTSTLSLALTLLLASSSGWTVFAADWPQIRRRRLKLRRENDGRSLAIGRSRPGWHK